MNQLYLGIDVSKEAFDVALLGEQTHQARFDNNKSGFKKLARWLKKRKVKQVNACLEATGRYWEELALFLVDGGHGLSVVNPKLIKRYAEARMQRNKNDRQDALTIAHFCATQQPDLWAPPSPARRQLKEMVRHLAALKEDRQRVRNRKSSGIGSPELLAMMAQQIAFLDEQIEQLEKQINDHIDQDPELKADKALLLTVPAVGDAISMTFLAEVPDVSLFARADQLAAYAGLTPGEHISGGMIYRRARLNKWGNSRLRTIFYMPALSAHRWNPIIACLKERLAARGKHKMTIVVAAMRKLLHLCYGVLKTRQPFDANYEVEPDFA